KLEKAGSKVGFAWGMSVEFRLNAVAVIATGLQIDYDRGYLNFLDTSASYYFNTKDQVLLPFSDTAAAGKSNVVFYQLNDRVYRTNYVTLPFCLKMKTKDIGGMTYFMKFGLNSSFRLKAKVNDNVTQRTAQKPKSSLTDLDNTDDMKLFRFQLQVGGGAEYNLSGTTSLVFGLGFNYGFSNVLTKESKYLVKNDGTATTSPTPYPQNAAASNIALTVGMLF
ncbi:MAG: outer membrane beta-barrel protein, partial [Bacteroidota bacterium]